MSAKSLRKALDAEARVHQFLKEQRVLFVRVGAYAHQDRVIPMYTFDDEGNTTGIDDEYDGILVGLVAAVLAKGDERAPVLPPRARAKKRVRRGRLHRQV